MERLTIKFPNGYLLQEPKTEDGALVYINAIAEKLGKLEDAEEQGLLLWLPCKVGDYAWDLIMRYRFEIVSIEIRPCGTIIFRCGNKGTEDYASFSLEDIGETWMLTEPKETDYWLPNKKAEAEQALKHTENAR